MQPHSALFEPFIFASLFTILPLVAWSLIWKGWALYLAARRKEVYWFIALLIINTAGLLEIFYIFAIAKRSDTVTVAPAESARAEDQSNTGA